MRSQEHAAPEIVLGWRRTGGDSLPCASVTSALHCPASPATGAAAAQSRGLCLRNRGGGGTKAVICYVFLSTHTSKRLCLPVYMPTDACANSASVEGEEQSDIALTQQDFTSSCSVYIFIGLSLKWIIRCDEGR